MNNPAGFARSEGLNRPLIVTVALLGLFGLATLYSAGQTDVPTAATDVWQKQMVWFTAGIGLAAVSFRLSPRYLEWMTPAIYVFAVSLLVLTLIVGTGAGPAASVRSWIALGGMRIGQPAELAKLATILMLARLLASRRAVVNSLRDLIPASVVAGVPLLLVALQPDLGSAFVFVGILFAMLFWAGANPWLLLLLASPLISLLLSFSVFSWGIWIVLLTALLIWLRPFILEATVVWLTNVVMGIMSLQLWGTLAPYQKNRLLSFLNPEFDPQAAGWHLIQSKVAIGSGGILGKGFTEGTQKRLAFLPEQHTDFIFPVVGEELGFAGVVVALALFTAFLLALVRIARHATDSYSCLLVFGVAGMIFAHVIQNIGMTVGLMPITGIPLPLFSYGGSFVIVFWVSVGLALRVGWDSRLAGYHT